MAERVDTLADVKEDTRAENEAAEAEAADNQAAEFEAFLAEQEAIRQAKEEDADSIHAEVARGGDGPKVEDIREAKRGKDVRSGKRFPADHGFREDPPGSGKFFDFADHSKSFGEVLQDRVKKNLKDRGFEPAGNFDPAEDVRAKRGE